MTTTEVGFSDKLAGAVTLAEKARTLTVSNAQDHATAMAMVEDIRALEKELEAEYKTLPVIVEAKRIQAVKSELAALLETARKTAKGRAMTWEDEQEAIRRKEEARLAAEAKRKADEDALAAAAAAQAAGKNDEAIAVLEEAIQAPAPVVVLPKTAPKTANRRKVTRFRLTNPAAVKRDYLTPDEVKIGQVVRALGKSAETTVGGIEVYEEFV